MNPVRYECEFEAEVLSAVLQARWPDRVDEDLRAHAAGCQVCSDVAAVAGALDTARDETRASAVIPDSGRVWWMAQMRARREAIDSASRPVTVAQAIALACAVGVLGACVGATSGWFQSILNSVAAELSSIHVKIVAVSAAEFVIQHGALVLGFAVVLFVVPAVFLLATAREASPRR